jgi:molybdenum-dependent DNA-binding transcriptional regulator ModE
VTLFRQAHVAIWLTVASSCWPKISVFTTSTPDRKRLLSLPNAQRSECDRDDQPNAEFVEKIFRRADVARQRGEDRLNKEVMAPVKPSRYFLALAVAEAGSFSRAADRLGISQPTVSQQMRDLEAGMRVSLFQRRGKRILLTSAGLIFQEHARAILRQLENFLEELNRNQDSCAAPCI